MSKKPTVTILTGGAKKIFENALNMYDNKLFKKALQSAKKIRKIAAENGEAMALEGLVRHALGEKEDGYRLVKEGLAKCLRYEKGLKEICLPFCFRAYALMYQADLNFEKCSASFINALRYDPNNTFVLRDLAYAQILLLDWEGLIITLRKLIKLQLSETKFWLGLALAYHQNGDFVNSNNVLTKWLIQKNGDIDEEDKLHVKNDLEVQRNRIDLYKLNVLFSWGKYEEVIKTVLEMRKYRRTQDLDKLLGLSYLKIGNAEKSKELFLHLLKQNPECHEYLHHYVSTQHQLKNDDIFKENVYLEDEEINKVCEILTDLMKQNPEMRNSTIKRSLLSVVRGERFEPMFFEFVKPYLTKTAPSLFEICKGIYENSDKIERIEKIMISIENSLENDRKYPELFKKEEEEIEGEQNEKADNFEEAPSTVLFCYLYLAKHFDKKGELEKGLEYINKAIEHTPTLCELYMTKARILKHLKRFNEASSIMEQSRLLDQADRFLNTESVKYLLLDQKVDKAYEVSLLFSNDHEGRFNLHNMQGVNFEMCLGGCFRRMGRNCLAFYEFDRVRRYFLTMRKSMKTFHDYFLNKCSIIEYIETLKYMSNIKQEPMYLDATAETVDILLLFDSNPSLTKYKISTQEKIKWNYTQKDKERMDELLEVKSNEDFLEQAFQLVRELEELRKKSIRTHLLGMEIYSRKKKPLLLLRSIKFAIQCDPKHEKIKVAVGMLKNMKIDEKMNEKARNIMKVEIENLEKIL